jgi:hypothetical protein
VSDRIGITSRLFSADADEKEEALLAMPPHSKYLPLSSSSVVNLHRGDPEPPRGPPIGNGRPSGSVIWANYVASKSLVLHLHRSRPKAPHGRPVENVSLS